MQLAIVRGAGRRAAACVAALAVGLTLAELCARALTAEVLAAPRCTGEVLREASDPRRGWELTPGSVMEIAFAQSDGSTRVVAHRVGPHGWRGEPIALRAAPGTLRIACVGDSNVFGWGVEERDAWPAQLGGELRAAGQRVETLNLGVPNIDVEQKAALVEQVAFELGCDVVVLALHFDDFAVEGAPVRELGEGAAWLARTRPGRHAWLDALRRNLRSVDVVVEGVRRRSLAEVYLACQRESSRPGAAERIRVEAALEQLARGARRRGVEVRVVVLPMPVRLGPGFASRELDSALEDAARSAGLERLDVATALARERGELSAHAFDLHLNARAHAAVAKALASHLAPLCDGLRARTRQCSR